MRHLNIKVYGRVQMVLFRDSTRRHAVKLGVKGFVRNEPDSFVYIEAEGDDEQLEKFLAWCKKGPILAKVEKVEVEESSELKNFIKFEAHY